MKRLFLSQITDDFNPEQDIVLGPWCFIDKEDIYPEWESLPFEPDIFSNPEDLAEASRVTCAFANNLVTPLSAQLNQQNGAGYSDRFWRLMLLPWLITLVQTSWFNLHCVQQFIEKYKDEQISVELISDSVDWEFKDTLDFLYRGTLNPLFEHWLYSRIVEILCPPSWITIYVKKDVEYKEVINQNVSWKRAIYNKIVANLRCKSVCGIGPIASIFWSIFLSIKPKRFRNRNTIDGCELLTNEIKWPFDFRKIIEKTIPLCFQNLKSIDCGTVRAKQGKFHLISPLIYYNESDKFRLGLSIEKGENLILTQHGGNYGNARAYSFPSEVEYKQHSFFSWGWTDQEDYPGNIKALSSPYLSKVCNKHKPKSQNLILVGTRAALFPLRLHSAPQPLQNLSYRRNKVQFLKSLTPNIFKETFYRPYFNDYGSLKDKSYFKKKFADLRICGGKLNLQILKCKLLVLDHPGTTLNIALAANIPMIGFWDKKAWSMCRQAVPYFEALENAGVLFQTGQDAAKKVNEIWDDVEGWWNQEQIQKARKDWCYQYARTNKFWWWEWTKELWKM